MKRLTLFLLSALLVLALLPGCDLSEKSAGDALSLSVIKSEPKLVNNWKCTYYLNENGVLSGWGQNLYYFLQQPLPETYLCDQPVTLMENVADFCLMGSVAFALKTDGTLWGVGRIPDLDAGLYYHEDWFLMMEGVADIDCKDANDSSGQLVVLRQTGELLLLGWRSMTDAGYVRDDTTLSGNIATSTDFFTPMTIDTGVTELNAFLWMEPYDESFSTSSVYTNLNGQLLAYTYYKGDPLLAAYVYRDGDYLMDVVNAADQAARNELLVIRTLSEEKIRTGSRYFLYYIDTKKQLWLRGFERLKDDTAEYGLRVVTLERPKLIAENVVQIKIASFFGVIWLNEAGEMWGCYGNTAGEFGTGQYGSNAYTDQPVLIDTGVADLCRDSFAHYLKTDGSLWCCGNNCYLTGTGQTCQEFSDISEIGYLAAQDNDYITTPTKVLDSVEYFVVGPLSNMSKLAKTTDGRLWLWGYSLLCRDNQTQTGDIDNKVLRVYRTVEKPRLNTAEIKELMLHDSLFVPTEWSEAWQSLAVD